MTPMVPFLISVPHGGWDIPSEVEGLLQLSRHDLFDDMDPFTQEIYDFSGLVGHQLVGKVYRAIVDLNRSPDDLPTTNPDGVVKSVTCHKVQVYKTVEGPSGNISKRLVDNYYRPYHKELEVEARSGRFVLGIDCHSMASYPPAIAPDKNEKRPLFCLGDNYGKACNPKLTHSLARIIQEVLQLSEGEVTHNNPFAGGYITQQHGYNPIPWIQLEMNRCLYLEEPWFDDQTLTLQPGRIQQLNLKLREVLTRLSNELVW